MKTYTITVRVRAENESDVFERLEDESENPIDSYIEESIKQEEV